MIDIKKHIGTGFGKGELYDTLIALQLESGLLPISGKTYFVSQMGNGTTGLSWENAFKTISAAITASNTYYAATGTSNVSRNRIFVDGANYDPLTVLPYHCDIIGVGTNARVQGATKIETVAHGCRIYNMQFRNNTAAPIFWTTVDVSMLEIHNCFFENQSSASTYGLRIYGNSKIKIMNNFISGYDAVPIGIQLEHQFITSEITGNIIFATTKGIVIPDGMGTGDYHSVTRDNIISGVNASTQLPIGIDIQSAACSSRMMIIHNWIAAADAIHYVGTGYENHRDHWMCIDNHVVQANIADTESDESAASL